uniref:Uncharacterized protein n=1 Tax=Vitis vinifera TaxID=29760 RepID=A5BTT5_VITVI|nr:hypothetical protein VITISV_006818 [Vitis vinifera]
MCEVYGYVIAHPEEVIYNAAYCYRAYYGLKTGTPPSKPRGTHLTVTCGTHCHPGHPHPDLPIKHTWHAFPDYLKEDQTTLINISSGRLTQYIRMINIFHPDTMPHHLPRSLSVARRVMMATLPPNFMGLGNPLAVVVHHLLIEGITGLGYRDGFPMVPIPIGILNKGTMISLEIETEVIIPMGPNGPYSKLIYLVDKDYEGRIDSKFTFVHKGVMETTTLKGPGPSRLERRVSTWSHSMSMTSWSSGVENPLTTLYLVHRSTNISKVYAWVQLEPAGQPTKPVGHVFKRQANSMVEMVAGSTIF